MWSPTSLTTLITPRAVLNGLYRFHLNGVKRKPIGGEPFLVDAQLIRDTREQLKVSRRVFAQQLQINERTLEKWEQGRAKPNKQATALILLTRKFPDTLKRLAQLAA